MLAAAISCTPLPPPYHPSARLPDPRGDARTAVLATPILIIEDEAIIAWMVEEVLEDAGFHTIEIAASGDQAIAAARRLAPGLIVSDVDLGAGIDGVDASREICGSRDIPVIFITGFATETMRERLATELPKANLLRKPVNCSELLGAVMRALAN